MSLSKLTAFNDYDGLKENDGVIFFVILEVIEWEKFHQFCK